MDTFHSVRNKPSRIIDLVRKREITENVASSVSQKLHVTENMISRLGLEKELDGHNGCVNCLEWNKSGEMLASASDDMKVILWDPFRYEKKLIIDTGHSGNIFSVKFMPNTNDDVVLSGAGDAEVRVHSVSRAEPLKVCTCHKGRVKRIATAHSVPYLYWSAGEDGFILQHDIRTPHTCGEMVPNNIIVNLLQNRFIECKCIAVNQKRPELIATGGDEACIRMYDRRMIKTYKAPGEDIRTQGDQINMPLDCVKYFIAGHLRTRPRNSNESYTTTYLTFSADGNELLANIGREQIYLFDVNHETPPQFLSGHPVKKYSETFGNTHMGIAWVNFVQNKNQRVREHSNVTILPPIAEELKREANQNFEKAQYNIAITLYNKAISHCPTCAQLYANRAAAYMKRAWDGDIFAALRDCETAIYLDPEHVKAYFRLARCLLDLDRGTEASDLIEFFNDKFPEYASYSSCLALRRDIGRSSTIGSKYVDVFWQNSMKISEYKRVRKLNTVDYKMRFCGHCNTTTDIKEVNYFGNDEQYIMAGSDDGSIFIWDRHTTNIVRILRGDDRIVNCVQSHPSTCLLATSGIDPVIRLWSPLPEDGSKNDREVQNFDSVASANQIRMNSDPFESMFTQMVHQFPPHLATLVNNLEAQQGRYNLPPTNCRPS